ncbi:MAG TPA: hypothetical protein VGD23_05510 [Sphingomicrobium sp.]
MTSPPAAGTLLQQSGAWRAPVERWTSTGNAFAAAGMLGLGLVQIAFAAPLPELHQLELSPGAARLTGLFLSLCALALLIGRRGWAAAGLTAFWAGWAALAFVSAVSTSPFVLPAGVPFAELVIFACWLLTGTGAGRRIGSALLPAAWGIALLLFGAIHLLYRDAIASMIPAWLPMRDLWPAVTGTVQLAAGVAMVSSQWRRAAAAIVALVYLSWIPVVHLPRLIQDPTSLTEWTFAITALVLAGCLMATASPKATGWNDGSRPDDLTPSDT